MAHFENLGEAFDDIIRFDREKFAAMPSHVQEELNRLSGLGVSPVDRVVRTAELLFANQEKLTRNVDKEMVGNLAEFAGLNGWHGMNEGNRAGKIKAFMESKAGGPAVAAKDIPEAKEEFKAPAPAPAPAPPPTTPAPAPAPTPAPTPTP